MRVIWKRESVPNVFVHLEKEISRKDDGSGLAPINCIWSLCKQNSKEMPCSSNLLSWKNKNFTVPVSLMRHGNLDKKNNKVTDSKLKQEFDYATLGKCHKNVKVLLDRPSQLGKIISENL